MKRMFLPESGGFLNVANANCLFLGKKNGKTFSLNAGGRGGGTSTPSEMP